MIFDAMAVLEEKLPDVLIGTVLRDFGELKY